MTGKAWYSKQLADPRWKSKRLEILERDNHRCRMCGTTKLLQVHHSYYEGAPWEVPNRTLYTVCNSCHFKVENGADLRILPQTEAELFEDIQIDIQRLMDAIHSKLLKYGGIVSIEYVKQGGYIIDIDDNDMEVYLQKINNKVAIAVETK